MLGHRKEDLRQLGIGRQRAVGQRQDRHPACGRLFGHVHHLGRVEAERHHEQRIRRTRHLCHMGRQPPACVQQHRALAQHRQHIAQKLDHRLRPQLPDQIDRIRRFQQVCRQGQRGRVHADQQLLQRGHVPRHQIGEKPHLAFPRAAQFRLQRPHPRIEPRGRRGQPPLEHRLQLLEAPIAQRLRIAHEAGGVDAAFRPDGIDRQHRHVVRVLRQVKGDLLIRLRHVVVTVMDQRDQLFIAFGRAKRHR